MLDNNGNPVAGGGSLEVWVFGKKRETPEQAAELGALRDPGDLTTTGDRPAFQPDAPANGSEEDTSDGLDIMLDVLGGASGAYANDVIDYAKGAVIFATFPPGYFMWQGYNFWGGLANGAVQGYEQDGVFGALAGAVNTLNPLALVGISLAATVDSAEKGDYAKAGEHGYQAAKVLAGIALGAISGGIKLGGGKGRIPDGAVVCRGGTCTAERFANGSGVTLDKAGRLQGVSVNTATTVQEASSNIPNGQLGVTTAGQIRAAGGEVVASPTPRNPYHATMSGITPQQAEQLFTPTILNPSRGR
ncbi:MAG: hypothetical protein IPM54_17345 [Polyangiaceae bacterium]|nr:hypothetical protein [Polyangiaceae bacterium]